MSLYNLIRVLVLLQQTTG